MARIEGTGIKTPSSSSQKMAKVYYGGPEAESFANGVRVTTNLTVSDPMPIVLTDQIKMPLKGGG